MTSGYLSALCKYGSVSCHPGSNIHASKMIMVTLGSFPKLLSHYQKDF